MSTILNIEQLFTSKLEGMERTPSPSAWKTTSRAVRRKQFFRFYPGRFNIYYLAGIILVGTAITYFLTGAIADRNAENQSNNIPERLLLSPDTEETGGAEEAEKQENQFPEDINTQAANQNISPESPDKKHPESGPETILKTDDGKNIVKDSLGISGPEKNTNPPGQISTLVPYFTPSTYEGCAPLTVHFLQSSINASQISWNFGTTESRQNPDAPVVTYTTPGTYTVTLTAMDRNGIQKTHSETIIVRAKPEAAFEIDQSAIYNYSIDASEFSWFLLSQEDLENNLRQQQPISTVFQPTLSEMLAPGKSMYNENAYLFLVAKNTYGCTDTVSSLLPEGSNTQLAFPTAFSPNPNGSTGGYYNPNDPANQVFHPLFEEVPESYHLRIFNKSGTLVFETTDIYIGWDGYYQESPSPKGVYIYQCTGTWKNGQPFQYRGDITILWNDK